nr:hypothetical protein OH820_25515 [Streptomyces sp. NBC_00857]
MSKRPQLPGDPSDLHLCISYDDKLWHTPQADRLESWSVAQADHRAPRRAVPAGKLGADDID